MNTRKILTALACMVCCNTAQLMAQLPHTCASDTKNDSLLANDLQFSRSFFYMEQKLAQMQAMPEEERTDDIYTLPVVVHIIHEGEAYGILSNISDEQIISAIDALNEDFRHLAGTNGDGAGPDVGIEFCLAQRDPNGQPTTGIVRVNGTSVLDYADQGIEAGSASGADEEDVKALSTWPRASYLNIWVVNEIENNDAGNGIQGYAYFPINNPIDGIVILYNAFGTVGTLKPNTNMNRTLTHEVGHYIGLYHTFHDTSSCAAEASCTTAGDRVCDTPVTIQNASCNTPACSGTQQVENYMDYTPQSCQDMFSEGQKLRMRTTLETQRTSMISSMGCMPVFSRDAGITYVQNPSGTICAGNIQPQVTLANFGSTTLTSVTINYNVDGAGLSTQSWTGSLVSGAQATITLNAINPAAGAHTLYVWTSNPNGLSDQNTSNDQATGTFTVSSGAAAQLVVTLDYFGSETTWNITDTNDIILIQGGPYQNNAQGTQITEDICLSEGCYTLTFMDSYGDGQGFTSGNFVLYDADDNILAQATGNWGDVSENDFCLTDDPPPPGDAPVASFTIQDNTVCKNIQVDFTSTSTNSPTTYSWTFEGGTPATSSAQNPQNITWANAGNYDVTLTATNAYGSHTNTCTNCMTVFAEPTVTLTGTNPTCSAGNNGSINNTVAGSAPFSYSWNNGATTQNLSSIGAGAYTVTVTSAQGCPKQQSSTLTAPTAITVTGTTTNPLCNTGNTGSITANATGGTGSKTYSWSNGAIGATANNLAAGSYTVTATDANGCTKTQSFTLTAPTAMTVTGTTTNPLCSTGNTGSITANATGGTGSKTYSWSNGATGATVSNLAAGSYTVTATDANGCTKTQSFTLTVPTAMTVTGTTTNPLCNTGNTGSITANATGGTGSKTYSWSNGASGATVSNLVAGSYTVTATDANGCTKTQSFTLTAPLALQANLIDNDIACSAQFGSAQVSPSGGTAPYTVTWSNGATSNAANNLSAGSYNVSIADANGCTASSNFTIEQSANLNVNASSTSASCYGNDNGTASVAAVGGNNVYTYLWNNGSTAATISGLAAGTYSVIVTDGEGCQGTDEIVVTQPEEMNVVVFKQDISCFGLNDGSASVTASGGTAPYTYSWSNSQDEMAINDLNEGAYTVLVTDANGCTTEEEVQIVEPSMMSANLVVISGESCAGNDGSAVVNVMGGAPGYFIIWNDGTVSQTLANVASGNYFVSITDVNGCSLEADIEIPYECEIVVDDTQLQDSDCGATEVQLTDMITCIPVADASMYMWRFMNETGIIISDEFSLGNIFMVSQIPGVAEGLTYLISVKALVNDVYGQFGPVCSITLAGDAPVVTTSLSDEFCNGTITQWGQTLVAIELQAALNYQWHITGDDYDWTTYTDINQLMVMENMQLQEGETYTVEVRCALGAGQFTEWGASCTITIGVANSVVESELPEFLMIYPNPSDGENIFFDFSNLPAGSTVQDLIIYSGNGKIVERLNVTLDPESQKIIEYRFAHPLAAGMYVMQYRINNQQAETKLIVR
ncbi:MAG: M43 family zinc metalloprotease [Flavobacteriales bacterium]